MNSSGRRWTKASTADVGPESSSWTQASDGVTRARRRLTVSPSKTSPFRRGWSVATDFFQNSTITSFVFSMAVFLIMGDLKQDPGQDPSQGGTHCFAPFAEGLASRVPKLGHAVRHSSIQNLILADIPPFPAGVASAWDLHYPL